MASLPRRMKVPEREWKRVNHDPTAPLRTPIIVGCALAVDKEFFNEIGSFDEGMDIWGGENVEIAFRVWQCGGLLEVIPCSRIGHLFRVSTYSFGSDKNRIIDHNNMRAVEVWMDDYKQLFYAAAPRTLNLPEFTRPYFVECSFLWQKQNWSILEV